jgi:predicted PurR-regulated permease PerM
VEDEVTDESKEPVTGGGFAAPAWAVDIGRWSWIIVGVVLVAAAVFALFSATMVLVMAALFAALIGGTFLPAVDWLAAHHLKRWMAALLVVVFLIALAVAIALIVVYGVVNQIPEMQERLDAATASIENALESTSVPTSTVESVKSGLSELAQNAASGAAGAIVGVVSGVGTLLFGIFIGLNILVWVFTQGREIGAWASRHMGPVPPAVGYEIFAGSARFFRSYIWGSTLVGLFNAAVLTVGAFVIGVPMAATIGIVAWFTNYIPYFGAIISGAFAVLIALGAGGWSDAIPMLIVVIIANGFLQTLISQFALGSALKLHPLAVLFATTAGGLLAGAVGGVFAAPFLKIAVDSYGRLRAVGLFGGPVSAVSAKDGTIEAGTGDIGPPDLEPVGPSGQT